MQSPASGNSGNTAQEATGRSEASKQQIAVAPENGNAPDTLAAPAPIAILPVTITVEADPLFDFDRSAVRPDSQAKLEQLVRQLKGINYGDIVAVGYADPIGTPLYNQELSERRAAAVKAYLTGLGIATNKIETEGRGETEEFANYQACGGLRTEKTIACLQPDRRVEVTVNARKQN
jgi:OOP family OmpA-OmpF porin